MSRFWAAGGASSGSESSDDDSSDYSSDASGGDGGGDGGGGGGGNDNKWQELSDDSSSDDEVRVAKSGKERALESFQKHIANLRTAMKKKDYYALQQEFDALAKSMIKAKAVLAKGVPRPLVRILCDLEDYVPARLADKAAFKKLSARQGRSLNRMKLTLKKHNKPYAVVMKQYRANPVVSDSDDSDSSDDDDDDDDDDKENSDSDSDDDSDDSDAKKKTTKKAAAVDSDDSDSDEDADNNDKDDEEEEEEEDEEEDDSVEDWASSSDESSSEDEEAGQYAQLKGRARWLKKNTVTKKKVVKDKDTRAKMRQEQKAAAALAANRAADAVTATKSVIPEPQVTPALLNKRVKEIAVQRGRRGTDHYRLLRQLEALSRLSLKFGPRIEIPILMYVVSAQFSLLRTMDDCMDAFTWRSCAGYLSRIATVLEDGYVLTSEELDESDLMAEAAGVKKMKAAASASGGAMAAVAADEKLVNPHTGDAETDDERAERLRQEKEASLTDEEKKQIPVIGSLSLHMTRLEEEYVKSLQQISHHSEEYVMRLRDESKLVSLLERFQNYFQRVDSVTEAAAMAALRIEHLYYRHDSIAKHVDKAAEFYEKFGEASMLHPSCLGDEAGKDQTDFSKFHPGSASGKPTIEEAASKVETTDWNQIMADLCTFVYRHGTESDINKAIICHVYHHAIHDRFLEARDLLLMSHIQENIYNSDDVTTMIMFNRMMVNVGMCAFRLGRIYDAHQCLGDICSGRVRELLAQGVSSGRFNEKTTEQEKAEKRRQVPYHQHINMDLLEACHLIAAMLLEVPNMAASTVEGEGSYRRNRVISRTFRKFHDQYDHQVFTGPPEQTRDFVMAAAKLLMKGDWKTCADLVTNLDVWQLIPSEGDITAQISTMLTEKIKLEGLRTYLFTFSSQYDSLSLAQLSAMFSMSKNECHSVVSKMIINNQLYASWDQPTETIVMRKVEPTSLQVMALQFAEKTANLVEANERLLDAQSGSSGYRDDNWKRGDGDGQGYNRGGRGGNDRGRGGGGGGGRGGRGRGSGRGGGRGGRGGRGRGSGGGRGRGGNNNNNNNNRRY